MEGKERSRDSAHPPQLHLGVCPAENSSLNGLHDERQSNTELLMMAVRQGGGTSASEVGGWGPD